MDKFDEFLSILHRELKVLDEKIDVATTLFDANEIRIAELEVQLGQTIQ